MFYCNNCNEIFEESAAHSRPAVEEDSLPPWEWVAVCPYCGSEDLDEASFCERCGEPIPPGESLCDCCRDDLYGIWDRAVCEVGGEYTKAKEILLNYIEEIC